MLRKSDLSTIIADSNHETDNPLWHGEVYTINQNYTMVNEAESKRVDPKELTFLATHEPCTLCSSANTWSRLDNFYYLFSHEDSVDSLNIGHDLNILKEVFKREPGGCARKNSYRTGYGIVDLVNNCDGDIKAGFVSRIDEVNKTHAECRSGPQLPVEREVAASDRRDVRLLTGESGRSSIPT